MFQKNKIFNSFLTVIGALSFSNSAYAGAQGVTIGHEPLNSANIPSLSGTMLIVLCILLAVVSMRLMKNKQGSTFLIVAILGSALVSGIGGVKMVKDAQAAVFQHTMVSDGAGFGVFPDTRGTNEAVMNNPSNGVLQKIISIEMGRDCFQRSLISLRSSKLGENTAAVYEQSISNVCKENTTVLQPGETCTLSYVCDLDN